MLNVDKNRKAIMSEVCEGADMYELECHIADLRGLINCGNCECDVCMRESFRWLFSEYKPPLLKNGDGLKPGDWIMIRDFDDQNWDKRQFAFYYDDEFFVAYGGYPIGETSTYTRWKQARLPEDGE